MPKIVAGENKARGKAAVPEVAARYITLEEAAEYYRMSERTRRRRIAEGKLPAWRVGPRAIRVMAADVEALAERIPTTDPAA